MKLLIADGKPLGCMRQIDEIDIEKKENKHGHKHVVTKRIQYIEPHEKRTVSNLPPFCIEYQVMVSSTWPSNLVN